MVGRRVLAVVALGLLGGSLGACGERPEKAYRAFVEKAMCLEDQPCWDWRTMGNKERGVCLDGSNYIESADGRTRPGGQACQARPLEVRCAEGQATVSSAGLTLPVGWSLKCPAGRSIPNGVATWEAKLIKIGDSAGDGDDHKLQFVIAHEICHAILMEKRDPSHWGGTIAQAEQAADRCAEKHGFKVVL